MLASIPAVAVAKSVFVYYFEKRTGRRIVAKDGVFFKGTPTEKEGMLVDPLADMSSPEGAGRRRAHRREHARGPRGSAEREQGSQDGEPPASQGEKPESSQGSGSAGNEDD